MSNNIKNTEKDTSGYEEAKKALTLMLLNKYNDLLDKEIEAQTAEIKAYESMQIFSESFKPEDLQRMMASINIIANNPKLTADYYKAVHEDAKKNEKVNE